MIIRKYYDKLHGNKMDNLDEMDKFLETNNLPKLNQKESENLNKQITCSEIEAAIKKLLTNKSPWEGFPGTTIKDTWTKPSGGGIWRGRQRWLRWGGWWRMQSTVLEQQ